VNTTQPPASRPRIRPASTLPANANCSTSGCHDNYAQAAYVHGPVAVNRCDACHGPEQAGHRFPLVRQGNDSCRACHVVFTGKAYKHQPADSGLCTQCHDPHAAEHKFLFRQKPAEQCLTCHPQPQRKFTHGPAAEGGCSACHTPHESDDPHLTIAPGAENCYRCHAVMRTRLAATVVKHAPVEAGCGTCHEPHSSDQAKLLKTDRQTLCLTCHQDIDATVKSATEQHGALLVQNGCNNCHDAHGSGEPKLLSDTMVNLCLKCHDKPQQTSDGRAIRSVKSEISNSAFLHGPVRFGQCQACHQVHGSSNTKLLSKTFPAGFYAKFEVTNYALCFSCHEKTMVLDKATTTLTAFRNGDRNLHFTHVNREKGRVCTSCHAIHGSDQPKHMASSVPFEGGGWSMPIKFAKTTTGGSCAPGCHQAYEYDREKAVTYPTTQGVSP
jgi:predicted CXXCH cytochrome family protein